MIDIKVRGGKRGVTQSFFIYLFDCRQIKLFLFSILTVLIIIGCGVSTTQNISPNSDNLISQMRVFKHAMGETKVPLHLPSPSYQDKDKNHENISLELIPQLEGDVIFLSLGGHDPSKLKRFTNHPLWSKLEAVREDRVYKVSSDTWIASWGMIEANRVLDDLFKYLIGK